MRPLRDGIQVLLRSQAGQGGNNTQLKAKHFDDIRVYFDTKLVLPRCTTTGLAYIVQFDVQPLQVILWGGCYIQSLKDISGPGLTLTAKHWTLKHIF